ncbi:MAG: cytochrome C oxidase subunit IV family protein [Saprospiraceae bacterium]|nr:cytochrome C oxidase subunit IV family protein [Saprospiraceae bacterium]
MGHLSYESSKTIATKTILILAFITIFEVVFALLGKGYLVDGFYISGWITGGMMILLSIVKAYLIVYEFMHMKYEVPGLVRTVLFPTLLLVWAIIAFLAEGRYWLGSRENVKNPPASGTSSSSAPQGMIYELPENSL